MKRMLIVLCFCMLASGCAPRTVIEDADPAEPPVMMTLAEEPEPIDYQVCAQIVPAAQAKIYRDIPLSHELQDIADRACEDYKIPQDVLYAVMKVESGYQVDAQNGSCYGLMQIHTINMEYLSSNIGTTDLTDPEQNIQAGAFILGGYLEKYSLTDSLMAYNLGEGGAKRLWKQGIHETGYTRKVLESIEGNRV